MTTYFSTGVSVMLTILAAVMWGSWMIVTKYRKDYPISGIVFWLYTFSFILIGACTILLAPSMVPGGLWHTTQENWPVILEIIFAGALMSLGMMFNLYVIGATGLLLATAVSSAVANVLGLVTSLFTEGVPDQPGAVLLFALVTLLFIAGGFVCNSAAQNHDKDVHKTTDKKSMTFKIFVYAILSAILINGWAMGTSNGTAHEFPPILTCFYMSLGSFISILIVCAVMFTKNKQWKQVLCLRGYPKMPLLLGAIAAVCHYGGNLISLFSMPALSATLSFLLGRIYTLISIVWGLIYKEFEGAKRKTVILLSIGIALNILALLLLGVYTFG